MVFSSEQETIAPADKASIELFSRFMSIPEALSTMSEEERTLDGIDLNAFFSGMSKGYWTYTGSLTTPPCTEGVTFVLDPSPLSVLDIDLAVFQGSATLIVLSCLLSSHAPFLKSSLLRVAEAIIQYDRGMSSPYPGIDRPVQPTNGRVILSRAGMSCPANK